MNNEHLQLLQAIYIQVEKAVENNTLKRIPLWPPHPPSSSNCCPIARYTEDPSGLAIRARIRLHRQVSMQDRMAAAQSNLLPAIPVQKYSSIIARDAKSSLRPIYATLIAQRRTRSEQV